jgi:hypothetical protein
MERKETVRMPSPSSVYSCSKEVVGEAAGREVGRDVEEVETAGSVTEEEGVRWIALGKYGMVVVPVGTSSTAGISIEVSDDTPAIGGGASKETSLDLDLDLDSLLSLGGSGIVWAIPYRHKVQTTTPAKATFILLRALALSLA